MVFIFLTDFGWYMVNSWLISYHVLGSYEYINKIMFMILVIIVY